VITKHLVMTKDLRVFTPRTNPLSIRVLMNIQLQGVLVMLVQVTGVTAPQSASQTVLKAIHHIWCGWTRYGVGKTT
jgi:hypothetical protein